MYVIRRERRKAVQLRDPAMYCMETEVHFATLPPHVQKMVRDIVYFFGNLHNTQIGDDYKLLIRVYYESGAYQTFQVDSMCVMRFHVPFYDLLVNTVADDFLPTVFPTEPHKRKRLGLPEDW